MGGDASRLVGPVNTTHPLAANKVLPEAHLYLDAFADGPSDEGWCCVCFAVLCLVFVVLCVGDWLLFAVWCVLCVVC